MNALPLLRIASFASALLFLAGTLPASTSSSPTEVCFGSDTDCPCSNGGDGNGGCDNRLGTGGAKLEVTTFSASSPQGALLRGSNFPLTGHLPTVLFRGNGAVGTPTTFGDGLLCVPVSNIVRLKASYANAGIAEYIARHGAGSGTFSYQVIYRDQPASFCTASAFNTTNGIVIDWL